MSRRILLWTALLVLCLPPQPGAAACFDSDRALADWVEAYYLHPDPERLACAAETFAKSPGLYGETGLRRPFANFIGAAFFALPPAQREAVLRDLDAQPDEDGRIVFVNGIWFMDSSESRDLVRRLPDRWNTPRLTAQLQRMAKEAPQALLAIMAPKYEDELQRLAQDIDCLWMRFMATGDPDLVLRILTEARYSIKAPSKGDELAGYTARWSLRVNLKHEKVRQILTARLARAGDEERQVIENVLERGVPQPGENQSGENRTAPGETPPDGRSPRK